MPSQGVSEAARRLLARVDSSTARLRVQATADAAKRKAGEQWADRTLRGSGMKQDVGVQSPDFKDRDRDHDKGLVAIAQTRHVPNHEGEDSHGGHRRSHEDNEHGPNATGSMAVGPGGSTMSMLDLSEVKMRPENEDEGFGDDGDGGAHEGVPSNDRTNDSPMANQSRDQSAEKDEAISSANTKGREDASSGLG